MAVQSRIKDTTGWPDTVFSISEAGRVTGYSRQSLHEWKSQNCPAFSDQTKVVNLKALVAWLEERGLGVRESGAKSDAPQGPVDFAEALAGAELMLHRYLFGRLRRYGFHEVEKEALTIYTEKALPVIGELYSLLEKHGLARDDGKPLGLCGKL